MPKLRPIKRKDLIQYLRLLDFTGPYAGGKHEYMQRSQLKVRIPNPHQGDISVGLLKRILEEADVSLQEWEQLW
jgi:predicted RNA binding protein YcfA (HicA-like mRNA interferase family)